MIKKGNLDKAILDAKNDNNNAIAYIYENAKLNNNGVLANTVFSLKNNYATKDSVSHASSSFLENFYPNYDATIVSLLKEAGATCAFKTHLDEFGLGGTGTFSHYGLIKNPLNKDHYVGGSSSGSAATLNDNLSFAIGSDTGDSVRKPASYVGKVGFKPSYGTVSRYGLFAFASSLDTVGWMTHNVNDSFEIANVLFKQDFKNDNTSKNLEFSSSEIIEKKPTVVSYLDCFDFLNNEIADGYKKLLEKLKADNIKLQPIAVDKDLLNSISVVYQIIAFTEASSNLANLSGIHFGKQISDDNWEQTYIKTRQTGLGLMVQRRILLGSYYLEKENQDKYLKKAQKMRRYIVNYFTNIHNNCDIFIYPATKSAAPAFDQKLEISFMDDILTNANLTGNPSITIPLGKEENNLPFSISIDAKKFDDVKMLQHALYIEKMIGDN
ncbi:amidase family protein [Mycoplasma zalophi]|uniref:Asp-tRNA(Asn)/Glu-tRNA(Gln) amidotransferase GatCAB subunit A n=1 Tax=Mycoplasma zalophi TaxID=191287 RepID=A0ABS6DQ26_9MOLU|nr:amidase family protein [Mycoplasma zalophi]MBU4690753.1 Asp-tRNA(Asn)/Glu-tRNA(Gln) amidotransferase GatCAB subunit A [Mycoplasma zalophi]MBU4692431.1 Asp-tRNA(Asn)/Glu-tRNA(Gln) amidotransferase GatCAB subunit A [Mycoplasma zalophi]